MPCRSARGAVPARVHWWPTASASPTSTRCAMDFPYGLCDSLSKAIPLEGVKPVSLKKAREMEPEINAIAEREEGVPELLELAGRLEDLTRNVGMHPGGVLIAPGQLTAFCPRYCAPSG